MDGVLAGFFQKSGGEAAMVVGGYKQWGSSHSGREREEAGGQIWGVIRSRLDLRGVWGHNLP